MKPSQIHNTSNPNAQELAQALVNDACLKRTHFVYPSDLEGIPEGKVIAVSIAIVDDPN